MDAANGNEVLSGFERVVEDQEAQARRLLVATSGAEFEALPGGQMMQLVAAAQPLIAGPSEKDVGRAFENLYANKFAWSEERAIWRVDQVAHWAEDKSRAVHEAARWFADLFEVAAQPRMTGQRGDPWAKAAGRLNSTGGRNQLVNEAKTGLVVPESVFDVDPFDLNTPSGVLDLRSGESFARTQRYTKITRARYDPAARSDRWDQFLEMVLPDVAVRAYVQRAFGASLSGRGGERLVFVIYGPPRSGKSTISNIVERALGNYATVLRHDALALRQYAGNAGHTSELIPLVGARAAFVHELPDGVRLNAALLKTIVGGESFSVSEKGKPHFETQFVAKLFLISNHPITMDSTDDAAWQRMHLLPFEHPIPADKVDKDAVMALAEDPQVLAAALAWMVRGWFDYRASGLAVPARIAKMAEQQRADNSPIATWLEASVERGAEEKFLAEAAFRSFREHAEAEGRRAPIDRRRFATELEAAGFRRGPRQARPRYWLGGKLISSDPGV